jgi:hypothetical protein
MNYYLRLEAVNIMNVIADTQNLNVIRGGSMLLRDAVKEAVKDLPESIKLQEISSGASIGLFRFEAVSKDTANDVLGHVKTVLHKDPFQYGTFVADVIEDSGNYDLDREIIISKNRWQQYQQLTVSLPAVSKQASVPCEVDGIRPATTSEAIQDATKQVSHSTAKRFRYGRTQKQRFYQRELQAAEEFVSTLTFTKDLKELTTWPAGYNHNKRSKLDDRMAVLYFDGNAFTKIQQAALSQQATSSAAVHQAFDERIRAYRSAFLKELLQVASRGSEDWKSSEGNVRLETLLWGGDEFTLVVPAWKGWQVLTHFCESSKHWTFSPPNSAESFPLTHAGGVVFCHANAPIHRITALARDLADIAKEALKERVKKVSEEPLEQLKNYQSAFAYEILESFDHLGQGVGDFRAKRFGSGNAPNLIVQVPEENFFYLPKDVAEVKAYVSRGQLYSYAQAYVEGQQDRAAKLLDEIENELKQQTKNAAERVAEYFGDAWPFHLIDLWDYIEAEDANPLGVGA